jgi:cell division septum initiation protein DivIVA
VATGEPLEPGQGDSVPPPGAPGLDVGSTELRRVPPDLPDASFPGSVRGYERRSVDAYVNRVAEVIAELEATRSPEAAVRHALERVGAQTSAILEHAGETAEEIVAGARQEAEESVERAKTEASEIVSKAKQEASEILGSSKTEAEKTAQQSKQEAADRLERSQQEIAARQEEADKRMVELHDDTEAIREERNQLLNDIRKVAAQVEKLASAAAQRFPPPTARTSSDEPTTPGDAPDPEQPATEPPVAKES